MSKSKRVTIAPLSFSIYLPEEAGAQAFSRTAFHLEASQLARRAVHAHRLLVKRANQLALEASPPHGREPRYEQVALRAEAREKALTAVAFAAIAIEGYLNDYGGRMLGDGYYESNLEKLTPLSKLVVLPRLIANACVPTDGELYEAVRVLFRLRNELMHPKSQPLQPGTASPTTHLFDDSGVGSDIADVARKALGLVVAGSRVFDPPGGLNDDCLRDYYMMEIDEE